MVDDSFERASLRALRRVPTNAELAERAKELDEATVIKNWIARHPEPIWPRGTPDARREEWLTWAVRNFLADPEISAWRSLAVQRAYERGFENGRRAKRES